MRVNVREAHKKNSGFNPGGNEVKTINILNDISKTIPDRDNINIEITKIVIGTGSVTITDNTDTFISVDNIKNRLEKINYFKKVKMSSPSKDRSGNKIRFMLMVNFCFYQEKKYGNTTE